MAAITPKNGRAAFVSAWDPHTYWELNSTNLGTNYGDDTSGNDDNTTVDSGDISTAESYEGLDNQRDPPISGWFDIYTVTDAAMLCYIPAGLSHGTDYGLFHNGGGTNAQSGWLRATTTGVEVGVNHNTGGTNQDALVYEIPDADLPGWFVLGFQFCSEGGTQGDMGLWVNDTKVRNATRSYQLAYGSGNPDFGNSGGDEILQASVRDPGSYTGGNWGSNTAINSSGILIANFTCDNPNQDNTAPDGNGDSFYDDYYTYHVEADASPDAEHTSATVTAYDATVLTGGGGTLNLTDSDLDNLQSESSTYSTARTGGGSVYTSDTRVGQLLAGGTTYRCLELFVEFDLSSLPGGSTIDSVTLSLLAPGYQNTGTDFVINAYEYDWGASLDSSDWRDPTSFSPTLLADFDDTTGWTNSSLNTFTENGSELSDVIAANAGGVLRLVFMSSRHIAGNAPTGDEYVTVVTGCELDIDYSAVAETDADAEHAAVTITGYDASVSVQATAGHSTITLTGYDDTVDAVSNVSADASPASVTMTGRPITANIDTSSGHAAATLSANDPSRHIQTGAEHSAMTVAAYGASATFVTSAEHASFSLTGFDAGVDTLVEPDAEHASFTLSSFQASVVTTVDAVAGHPGVTVTGYDATIDVGVFQNVDAAPASATLAGYAPSRSIASTVEHTTVTIAGHDATISTVSMTSADAGHASLTVGAYQTGGSGTVGAGHASFSLDAQDMTTNIGAASGHAAISMTPGAGSVSMSLVADPASITFDAPASDADIGEDGVTVTPMNPIIPQRLIYHRDTR